MPFQLPKFQRTAIAASTLAAIRAASTDWEIMLVTILGTLLERFERRPDYPFVDSKLSLLTGRDFPAPQNLDEELCDFKGPTALYGWIQGRGLEALVGHARWLPECTVLSAVDRTQLEERTRSMIAAVVEAMETLRAKIGGHITFLMHPDGRMFDMDDATRTRRYLDTPPAASTMGDLFYVKGLQAAARYLAQPQRQKEARAYFRQIAADIVSGAFISDGVYFDPKNNRRPVAGRHSHGARMIGLGACALFARSFPGEDEWFDLGCAFIQYILDRHVQLGQLPPVEMRVGQTGLQLYDMFEGADAAGRPWREPGGAVLSDPGHSTEFVGLAAKFLFELDKRRVKTPAQVELLATCRKHFPAILLRNFQNGFQAPVGGICKAYDLIDRVAINSDMPWWNLPETLRAGAEVLRLCPDLPAQQHTDVCGLIQQCSNGFFRSFVNENIHLMAYQTVSAAGQPVDVIPATADADPGYHTGLSIIDYLRCLQRI